MPVLNFEQVEAGNDTSSYGVTFEDVKAYLPHRRWNAEVRPGRPEVDVYIDSWSSMLGVLVRPLPVAVDLANRLLALCHRAVLLGAASDCEAAGAPERAKPNDASSYAEWLRRQAQLSVDECRAFADAIAPGDQPAGIDPKVKEPAWSFPDPVGWANRGM